MGSRTGRGTRGAIILYLYCCLAAIAAVLLMHIQDVGAAHGGTTTYGRYPKDYDHGGHYSGEDPDTTNYDMQQPGPNGRDKAKCKANNCCKDKIIKCPKQCPKRTSTAENTGSCFIDCSRKCQATCRRRKPNCNGYSSVCYDPRFVGGDGVMFYFHGKSNEDFCLVSDPNVHINAHFIGIRPEGRARDFTWVQTLGILFQGHKLSIGAKSNVASWDDSVDQLEITYDGQNVRVPTVSGAAWTDYSDVVQIERLSDANSAQLRVGDLLKLTLQVVPITKDEDRVHGYGLSANNVFAHLNMQVDFIRFSDNIDGVLGQTYRPGYVSPVKVGVPMPVMGGEVRFRVTSLFATDCVANQFVQDKDISGSAANVGQATASTSEDSETVSTECASSFGAGGLLCRQR